MIPNQEKLAARAALFKASSQNLRGFRKLFAESDTDGDKSLSIAEFKATLESLNIEMTADTVELFDDIDANGDGKVTLNEFLKELYGAVSEERKQMLEAVFAKLDKDGSGAITYNEVKLVYNVKYHPNFGKEIDGVKWDEEKVFSMWCQSFNGTIDKMVDDDAKLTQQEFMDYYVGVSNNMDDDEEFKQLLLDEWLLDYKEFLESQPQKMEEEEAKPEEAKPEEAKPEEAKPEEPKEEQQEPQKMEEEPSKPVEEAQQAKE